MWVCQGNPVRVWSVQALCSYCLQVYVHRELQCMHTGLNESACYMPLDRLLNSTCRLQCDLDVVHRQCSNVDSTFCSAALMPPSVSQHDIVRHFPALSPTRTSTTVAHSRISSRSGRATRQCSSRHALLGQCGRAFECFQLRPGQKSAKWNRAEQNDCCMSALGRFRHKS